jgi:hypothetical protein
MPILNKMTNPKTTSSKNVKFATKLFDSRKLLFCDELDDDLLLVVENELNVLLLLIKLKRSIY